MHAEPAPVTVAVTVWYERKPGIQVWKNSLLLC